MKEKENVYEETTRSEDATAVEGEKASTVPSKFKDVDALARAYSSLQAEFTRRSQKLKELEKRLENFEGEVRDAHSGAEKLRGNAKARREEEKQFDKFMAETVGVELRESDFDQPSQNQALADYPSKEDSEEMQSSQNEGSMSATNVSLDAESARKDEKERTGKVVSKDGTNTDSLYEQVCRDEEVRLKIIGEYLASIGKSGAPLMTGGVGVLATPPQKPKNISEAGNMALSYFKKTKAK